MRREMCKKAILLEDLCCLLHLKMLPMFLCYVVTGKGNGGAFVNGDLHFSFHEFGRNLGNTEENSVSKNAIKKYMKLGEEKGVTNRYQLDVPEFLTFFNT